MSSPVLGQLQKHFVLQQAAPPSGAQQPPGTRGKGNESPRRPPGTFIPDTGREGHSAGQAGQRKDSHPSGCSEGGRRQQTPRGAAGCQTSLKHDPEQTRCAAGCCLHRTGHCQQRRSPAGAQTPGPCVCVRSGEGSRERAAIPPEGSPQAAASARAPGAGTRGLSRVTPARPEP